MYFWGLFCKGRNGGKAKQMRFHNPESMRILCKKMTKDAVQKKTHGEKQKKRSDAQEDRKYEMYL